MHPIHQPIHACMHPSIPYNPMPSHAMPCHAIPSHPCTHPSIHPSTRASIHPVPARGSHTHTSMLYTLWVVAPWSLSPVCKLFTHTHTHAHTPIPTLTHPASHLHVLLPTATGLAPPSPWPMVSSSSARRAHASLAHPRPTTGPSWSFVRHAWEPAPGVAASIRARRCCRPGQIKGRSLAHHWASHS